MTRSIDDVLKQPANLIPELCAAFYRLGWVTGTGGGICIRTGYQRMPHDTAHS